MLASISVTGIHELAIDTMVGDLFGLLVMYRWQCGEYCLFGWESPIYPTAQRFQSASDQQV
jgi:hypothetical protein